MAVDARVAVGDEADATDIHHEARHADGVVVVVDAAARIHGRFNREVADLRAVRDFAEKSPGVAEVAIRRYEPTDRVPLPEELAVKPAWADIVPSILRDVVGEVEIVHERECLSAGKRVAADSVDHVRPIVHRVDWNAEPRADRADVLHRVCRDARRRVREAVADPTSERHLRIVGYSLDREDRPRRIRFLGRLAVDENLALRADYGRKEPEVGVFVHGSVEIRAGGADGGGRMPDVREVVVRHRRRRRGRELSQRKRLNPLRIRIFAVADRRLLGTVAVLEVVRGRVVGSDPAEGAGNPLRVAVGFGKRPERETARDGQVVRVVADGRAPDEAALGAVAPAVVATLVYGAGVGRVDRVAVLDRRPVGDVFREPSARHVDAAVIHGPHAPPNRSAHADGFREARVERAHVRDAVGRAVLYERSHVEGGAEAGRRGTGTS